MTNRRKEARKLMRLDRRILISAALAIGLACTPAGAQDSAPEADPEATGIVGPPQLREFQLPGRTTTPAPSTVPAAPPQTEPEPAVQQPPVIVLPDAPQAPTVVQSEQKAGAPSQAPASQTATADTETAPPAGTAAAAPADAAPPQPVSTGSGAAAVSPDVEPAGDPVPAGGGIPWLYIALAALFGAIAAIAFVKLRAGQGASAETEQEQVAEAQEAQAVIRRPVPAAAPPAPTPVRAPAPAPAPAPASNGVVGIQIRPWLNLEFRPAQAAATLTEAVVQFELLITNSGNAIARNVRVEAKMFNAGVDQDKEISDFFARPVNHQGRSRILAIPPRSGARMRSRVAMPNESVREITVDGRRLFIPMVAINVVYEWGEGRTGQTSMSYLVGREPETPSTKMGAFRLDLGPRVYRSVGQRPSNVAVLV